MNELKIGERIAKLRNLNNITQMELAEKLGVSDRAVSKWETGCSYPDIVLIPQIADIFNVRTDYLLRGEPAVKYKFFIDYTNTKYNETINNQYLENGWEIADINMSGTGDGSCVCAVLFKKEIFED